MNVGFQVYKNLNLSLYYPINLNEASFGMHHDLPVQEIFVRKIYEKYFNIDESDIILDLGSHIGIFSIRALGQGAKSVHCIECEPIFYEVCQKNLSWFPDDKYSTDLYHATSESIENLIKTSDTVFNFWKLDIEGYEYEVLENKNILMYLLQNSNKITLEFHNTNLNIDRVLKLVDTFEYFGWKAMITDVAGLEILQDYRNNVWYDNVQQYSRDFYTEVLGYFWKE